MSERYNTYVGARYVPIFDGDWDNTKQYEPLTIVSYQGDSYTSKTYVPTGAPITNETYWAKTGNYNAQVQQLYEEVVADHARVDQCENDVADLTDRISGYDAEFTSINQHLSSHDTAISNLNQRVTNEVSTLNNTITADINTVNSRITSEVATLNGEIDALEEQIQPLIGARGFVTPEMFNAVGDGVTPDNTALNQCFAYAVEHNIPVVGIGTYLVTPSPSVTISGGVSCYNLKLTLKEESTNFYVLTCTVNKNNYLFANCSIDFNSSNYSISSLYGFYFQCDGSYDRWIENKGNITFENCKFLNVNTGAIEIAPTIDSTLVVNNCHFANVNNSAIHSRSRNVIITNCTCTTLSTATTGRTLYHSNETALIQSATNKKKLLYMNNCTTDSRLIDLTNNSYNDYKSMKITNCSVTDSLSSYYTIKITTSGYGGSWYQCVIDNCDLNGINCMALIMTNGTPWVISNTHFDSIIGYYGDSIHIDNCDIGHKVDVNVISDLIISNSHFTGGAYTDALITTQTSITSANDSIDYLILNNVTFNRISSVTPTEAIIHNAKASNIMINGLVIDGEQPSTELLDNTSLSLSGFTSKIYGQGIKSLVDRASGKYFIKGMSTAIIDCIAPSGAITLSNVTNSKINRIWLT